MGRLKKLIKSMRTSVVKMIFKKGDRKIGNCRPVSLVCTYCKILAKIITEKLKPVLKKVIWTEQKGFIEGGDMT